MTPVAKSPMQAHQQVVQMKKVAAGSAAAPHQAVKIQSKAAIKTAQVVKKQPALVAQAPAPKAQPASPKTVAMKKVHKPQQL